MKSWLMHHWQVLLFTLQHLRTAPLSSLLNVLVIGVALSLPTGGYLLLLNTQQLAGKMSATPQLSLFLDQSAGQDDVAKLQKRLNEHPGIARAEFVSREQALKQLQHSLEMADLASGLGNNPLPHAFIVHPKDSQLGALEKLRDELKNAPRVEHVQMDSTWIRKLQAILKFGRIGVLILATLLSFALIAITFNTIRLQILTRKDEIEVSRLIGASNNFIRRPFLYFGLFQGFLGGVVAWLIVFISLALLNASLGSLTELYASEFTLHHLSAGDSLTLLFFSAYLGWLGALLSVSQHLWKLEPS